MSETVLYEYWRSSASYRVRIALHRLGIAYRSVPVDLTGGEHRSPGYLSRNPQGLVPSLEIDGQLLTQSLAIIEYLDETRQAGFLPPQAAERARVRALAHAVAMDIHPVCNMSVAAHAMEIAGGGEEVRIAWMRKFIGGGLAAVETMLHHPSTGRFCHGDRPGLRGLLPRAATLQRPALGRRDRQSGSRAPHRRSLRCAAGIPGSQPGDGSRACVSTTGSRPRAKRADRATRPPLP